MTDHTEGTGVQLPLDIEQIKAMLPHRYPFLLIDRVIGFQRSPRPTVQVIKNVTANEPFFQGHFPGHPVMPGVLVVEAMAQAAGVLTSLQARADGKANLYYLVKVDKARFNRTVVPGDQLLLEVTETRRMRGMGQFECVASVDGHKVASAELLCAGRG